MKTQFLNVFLTGSFLLTALGCGSASGPEVTELKKNLKEIGYLTTRGGGGDYTPEELYNAVNKAGAAGVHVNGHSELKKLLAEWEQVSSDLSNDFHTNNANGLNPILARATSLGQRTQQSLN